MTKPKREKIMCYTCYFTKIKDDIKKSNKWKKIVSSFKKDISKLKNSKNPDKAVFLILALTVLLTVIAIYLTDKFFFTITAPIMDIFNNNFGTPTVTNSLAVFLLCLIVFTAFFMINIFRITFLNDKPNWLYFVIASVTITVFLVGTVFIDGVTGVPNNEWKLYNDSDAYVAKLKCFNANDRTAASIVNETTACYIEGLEDKFSFIHGYLNFTSSERENNVPKEYSEEISKLGFVPSEDPSRINIRIEASDEKDKRHNLSSTIYPRILTREKSDERSQRFLTYFFGLLFVCIITLPGLVIKLRDASKK